MADKNRTYCKEDFWVQKEGNACRVGLSFDVLEKIQDSAFVELPSLGEIKAGDPFLHVETSKVAHEISSPFSGMIREVNETFCEKENWIAVIENVE